MFELSPPLRREELDTEHRAQLREFSCRAHNVNLDLGAGLTSQLLQWTADSRAGTTVYPTGLPGYTQSTRTDVLGRPTRLPAAAEADYALLRRETVGALGKALKPHLPAASEHA